jgi:hypothetical protein
VAALASFGPSSSSAASRAECAELELSARYATESAPFANWTQAQKDAYITESAAQCYAEAAAEEAAVAAERAKEDEAIRQQEEREAAKSAARELEQRETRQEEARDIREHRREAERRAREWAHKPTMTLYIASHLAARTLRNAGYPNGWVECQGGRINRTHWSCKAHLFYQCLVSRMQVWGAGYKNGRPLYSTKSGRFHPCQI